MNKDLVLKRKLKSSFLSCEKDVETILRRLFIESQPYSDELKRLLVISAKDCLDNKTSETYKTIINSMTLAKLREKGYIKLEPKIKMFEHEEVKSYLMITFDNFVTNPSNPKFRDCTVMFDIFCHTDYWDIGNYRCRPLKIAGYIDGILQNAKLSGIGTFQFSSCSEVVLDENLSGYCLIYKAIHGSDDKIPPKEIL